MLTFSHFEKDKNQFQLIRYFIHDLTLGIYTDIPKKILFSPDYSENKCIIYVTLFHTQNP